MRSVFEIEPLSSSVIIIDPIGDIYMACREGLQKYFCQEPLNKKDSYR